MRANERSERPSGPFKTRLAVARNAPCVEFLNRNNGLDSDSFISNLTEKETRHCKERLAAALSLSTESLYD